MFRIAMVWFDGCRQVVAFPTRDAATRHTAWMARNAGMFRPRAVAYCQDSRGRFVSLTAGV